MTSATAHNNGRATRGTTARKTFGRSRGVTRTSHKLVIYGTGGIGKSSLAAMGPSPLFIDLEDSTLDMDVERLDGVATFDDVIAACRGVMDDPGGSQTLVIDSVSKLEELCVEHVIATIPHEKGQRVNRIEDYGFGKGYVHVVGEWKRMLQELSAVHRCGLNVVLVAHETVTTAPNPSGEDFKRYSPRLQQSERANVMAMTKEWADHVAFVSYDVAAKDKKGRGSGTRTIYLAETPAWIAKTRSHNADPMPYAKGDPAFWDRLMTPAEPEETDEDFQF